MKANNFKEMTDIELQEKLKSLKEELFNLRFSHATGQLANPMALSTTKKDIARVLTVIKERQIHSKI
ncbi:MAG: 50S ribosomal protein L29 [Bacilli bacterium]